MKATLIMLFIILCCSSCCNKKRWNELSSDELSWLPYKVGDTLHFKSNLGNYDNWIVTSKEYQEFSYGEGRTKCTRSYCHSLNVNLLNEREDIIYEMIIGRDAKKGNAIITVKTPGAIAKSNDVSSSDSLTIEAVQYLSSISTYLFKNGVGLKQYKIKDSMEVYEKI